MSENSVVFLVAIRVAVVLFVFVSGVSDLAMLTLCAEVTYWVLLEFLRVVAVVLGDEAIVAVV